MGFNEFNAIHNICPDDEMLLYRELRIPITGSDVEVILELQNKLSAQQQINRQAERIAAGLEEIVKKLKTQVAAADKKVKVLSQENAGLLNMLHNERESHEQSRLLMEKRIALASVRNDDKKPLAATQGVKNAYPGSYAERVRAKRF